VRSYDARVESISLDPSGRLTAWITCPVPAIPEPGRFSLATAPAEGDAALPVALFSGAVSESGFVAVGELPFSWVPGISIRIRGPMGQGFRLPETVRRLALAACDNTAGRLIPLAQTAARQGADIAWFTDAPLPAMPAAYELNPLHVLPDSLAWADFVAVDLPLPSLPSLGAYLGIIEQPVAVRLPCPGQVLVYTAMPCGGAAECGACSVPLRRGWKLACQDGPVFDLDDLVG
jgi:hypothetical protein